MPEGSEVRGSGIHFAMLKGSVEIRAQRFEDGLNSQYCIVNLPIIRSFTSKLNLRFSIALILSGVQTHAHIQAKNCSGSLRDLAAELE